MDQLVGDLRDGCLVQVPTAKRNATKPEDTKALDACAILCPAPDGRSNRHGSRLEDPGQTGPLRRSDSPRPAASSFRQRSIQRHASSRPAAGTGKSKPGVVNRSTPAGLVLIRQGRGEAEILLGQRHGKSGFRPTSTWRPAWSIPATIAPRLSGTSAPQSLRPNLPAAAAARPRLPARGLAQDLRNRPADRKIDRRRRHRWALRNQSVGLSPMNGLAPDFNGIDFLCRASRRSTRVGATIHVSSLMDGGPGHRRARNNGNGRPAWRRGQRLRHLNIVDVTQYVLEGRSAAGTAAIRSACQSPGCAGIITTISRALTKHQRRVG